MPLPFLPLFTLAAHAAAPTPAPTPAPAPDRWSLYRVEQPDHPEALATSATGSVLAAPPETGAFRVEEVPQVDRVPVEEVEGGGESGGEATADTGEETLQGVGTWRAWDADAAMQVSAWHAAGIDGSRGGDPVKVAIFDVQWYGASLAADELGAVTTHDCWAHPSCDPPIDDLRPAWSWEVGSHGVACAEVLRDLAPGVELHLVRVNGVTTLENAVDWAIREGIEVVSMSMSFFNNSFYDGTGPVAELMDRLSAGGVLMVSSAGNYADQHWHGAFRDEDGDGLHRFSDERRTLPVYLGPGEGRVVVTWDDFDQCGRTDLDAWVYAGDGTVVGRGEARQTGGDGCEPVERIRTWAAEEGWYYLEVRRIAGDPDPILDVLTLSGEAWEGLPGGSVTDPGSHPAVLTVGAVQAEGYATNPAEDFSSRGPTNGGQAKPDLAGPDGITTSVYGPSAFYGTSAATPSVAAAVALLMSAEPGLDGAGAALRLRGHTLADATAAWQGADPALGEGRVRLAPPSAGAATGCGGRAWLLVGVFLPTLAPALARARAPGPRRRHGGLAATLEPRPIDGGGTLLAPPAAPPSREP